MGDLPSGISPEVLALDFGAVSGSVESRSANESVRPGVGGGAR